MYLKPWPWLFEHYIFLLFTFEKKNVIQFFCTMNSFILNVGLVATNFSLNQGQCSFEVADSKILILCLIQIYTDQNGLRN